MDVCGKSSDATMRRVRSSKRVHYGRPNVMLAGREIIPLGAKIILASRLGALDHMSHPIAGQDTFSFLAVQWYSVAHARYCVYMFTIMFENQEAAAAGRLMPHAS